MGRTVGRAWQLSVAVSGCPNGLATGCWVLCTTGGNEPAGCPRNCNGGGTTPARAAPTGVGDKQLAAAHHRAHGGAARRGAEVIVVALQPTAEQQQQPGWCGARLRLERLRARRRGSQAALLQGLGWRRRVCSGHALLPEQAPSALDMRCTPTQARACTNAGPSHLFGRRQTLHSLLHLGCHVWPLPSRPLLLLAAAAAAGLARCTRRSIHLHGPVLALALAVALRSGGGVHRCGRRALRCALGCRSWLAPLLILLLFRVYLSLYHFNLHAQSTQGRTRGGGLRAEDGAALKSTYSDSQKQEPFQEAACGGKPASQPASQPAHNGGPAAVRVLALFNVVDGNAPRPRPCSRRAATRCRAVLLLG